MRSSWAKAGLGIAVLMVGLSLSFVHVPDSRATLAASRAGSAGDSEVTGSDYPGTTIVEVLRERDAFTRARRLSTLLPKLGPEAIPEIRSALESPAVELGAVETTLLVRSWSIHDPAAGCSWANAQAPIAFRAAVIEACAETWARADPRAASEWARTASAARGAMAAEGGVIRGWFYSGQPGLVEYIEGLGPSFERQRALSILARRWIQRDGAIAAMQWAESLPDEPQRFKLAAFRQLGSELAKADPAMGVAWCEAQCEGRFGSNLRKLVAMRWARQDGPAAMKWLSEAAPGMERDLAVRDAFMIWLRMDREQAIDWMEATCRDGVDAWIQPALDLFAVAIGGDRPAEALRWIALIEDDTRRETAAIRVVRGWREHDAEAAEAWLEESPLPEEARKRARSAPKGRRRPKSPVAVPLENAPGPTT